MQWKLTFGDCRRARLGKITARNSAQLQEEIDNVKKRFRLRDDLEILS